MRSHIATALWACLLLACAAAAHAQIYASAAPDSGGAVVLSNHPSQDTPLLLLGGPAEAASAVPVAKAPRPGSRVASPEQRSLIDSVATEVAVAPQLLHAVIAAESNFDARAVSPKGALGLMQLMPAVARRFGAKDPFSPADNVRAGARYLKWLAGQFGDDVVLVLAAYNAGEQAVRRAGGRVPDYAETRAYVPRVLSQLHCVGVAYCTGG